MPDPSSMVDDRQVRRAVQDAVAMLSPSQRLATTLFYAEGLSYIDRVFTPLSGVGKLAVLASWPTAWPIGTAVTPSASAWD